MLQGLPGKRVGSRLEFGRGLYSHSKQGNLGKLGYLVDSSRAHMLWAVDEFSGTLADLEARFGSEQACWDYLLTLRWPEGFVCPRCGGLTAWTTTRRLLVCAGC
jgi:hypothetical protein